MTAERLLKQKGSDVVTVNHSATINEAIEALVRHNIGAVMVVDQDHKPVGIVSERDILREVHHRGDLIGATTVDRIMSKDLIVGLLSDTLDYIQCVFTKNRIRHLPIVEHGKMVGILSIGDVVKARLQEQQVENHYLRDFIMDKYPG